MNGIVYILKSKQNKYYIGSTNDLDRRLKQHKSGHTPTTKRIKTFDLVFHQKYDSLNKARLVEKKIKSWKRKDYIEKIIKEGKIRLYS